MLTLELREKASAEAQAARAIKEKADDESRGLTPDEARDFDMHLVESARIEKEAERQAKLESTENRLNKKQDLQVPLEIETANGKRIEVIPSSMFRFGQLRSFKGPKAESNAYAAGKWLMATIMSDANSRTWCRDHNVEMRVQTEGINTAGGFVVPDVMERAIIDLRETYGMFRANTRVLPMSTDHTNVPRRSGGVDAYFIGETSAITESEKSWNQVELTAKKLGALTRMSTDLSEDAIINIADDLAQEMAWAFAKKEDECGLDGDGTSTYGGMVGIRTRFVDGTHTFGQVAGVSTFTAWSHGTLIDEIIPMMGKLPSYALANAKWYIHPTGKAGLFDSISMAAGGATAREIVEGVRSPMFAGYPIVTSAAMPVAPVATEIAFLFGDLSLSSTFGDRRGITIKVSDQRYMEYDQIGIQATERFCIVNHDLGDNTTAGPIIAITGTA